ncbi:helix-turn-helix transcriptional regulator [Ensifer sp. ENS04]|uniref:LexA family transcriptional regulator n=1 Tax=Ensifer sp. ENS04 TaxID=2769281 RepID=UPI001787554D|nr:helix-turn-helix domain-containing protein [Ensifer sp. ENS04]MBD9542906.1 helix-turn-helix transcriptional regulator [Ensifer sp. ENS04]
MSRLSDKLTEKANELGISQTELANRVGVAQQSISELFNGNTASPRKWREIADELQISHHEMRQLMIEAGRLAGKTTRLPRTFRDMLTEAPPPSVHPGAFVPPNATIGESRDLVGRQVRKIPVLGEAVGGDDGEYIFNGSVLDYVDCPPSLENVPNAYAVYIDGESMSPRFRPGETVWVHPTKPARRGDDVVVQIHRERDDTGDPPRGFVKEFVGWTSSKLLLHQFNPDKAVEFMREQVLSVHPIILSGKYW